MSRYHYHSATDQGDTQKEIYSKSKFKFHDTNWHYHLVRVITMVKRTHFLFLSKATNQFPSFCSCILYAMHKYETKIHTYICVLVSTSIFTK
ncbi:hypothetical protein Hanom_Chr15g01345461 [Helianthus anomalus]